MPWDCFCPKCSAATVGGMEDDPELMELEMDEYRGETITCDSCGCKYDFDTGEIRDCDTCQNKHLDYKYFCVDCQPYDKDHSKSNYEDMHEDMGEPEEMPYLIKLMQGRRIWQEPQPDTKRVYLYERAVEGPNRRFDIKAILKDPIEKAKIIANAIRTARFFK